MNTAERIPEIFFGENKLRARPGNRSGKLIQIFAVKKRPKFSSNVKPLESKTITGDKQLRLIPWQGVWTSLSIARMQGRTRIVDSFMDALFAESLFDDRGVWFWQSQKLVG